MKYLWTVAMLLLAVAVVGTQGCSGISVTPDPAPSPSWSPDGDISHTPDPEQFPKKGWPANYDAFIYDQVPAGLLAIDKLDFCPGYSKMDEASKRKTWAVILKGIAKPESGWDRTNRYREPGMVDKQGRQVYSEGLLQLSYQDAPNYGTPWCNKMSRTADAGLADNDLKKTIFHPYINLGCGLEISERLLKKHNATKGAVGALGLYWSTIRRGKCEARKFIRENSACGQEPDGC